MYETSQINENIVNQKYIPNILLILDAFATQIVLLGNFLNLLDVSARVTIIKVILRKRSKR